jgi:hypothetical protein
MISTAINYQKRDHLASLHLQHSLHKNSTESTNKGSHKFTENAVDSEIPHTITQIIAKLL